MQSSDPTLAITLTNSTATTSLIATGTPTAQGNIDLPNANNDFTGAVTAKSAGYTTINDVNDLAIATITAGGKATLTANDISIANLSTAYGGFKITAMGSVQTNDLVTTDGTSTNPGADVVIDAYAMVDGAATSINTGNIEAGTGNVAISLSSMSSTDVGSITIGGNISGNSINIINSGSTGLSNIVVTGNLTASGLGSGAYTGLVELNAQDDITINGDSFADIGFDIIGANIKTGDLNTNGYVYMIGYNCDIEGAITAGDSVTIAGNNIKILNNSTAGGDVTLDANGNIDIADLTTTDDKVELSANMGGTAIGSFIKAGNITAGTGNVTISQLNTTGDTTEGAITVGGITSAKNIDIKNGGTSTNSNINLGASSASGTVKLAAGNDINLNGKVETSGGILNADAGQGININSDIITNNGNITMIANEGTPSSLGSIIMADGTTMDAGGGNITLELLSKSNSGDITVYNITGKDITVDPFNFTVKSGGTYTGTGTSSITATNIIIESGGTANLSGTSSFNATNDINISGAFNTVGSSSNVTVKADNDVKISGTVTSDGATILKAGNNIELNSASSLVGTAPACSYSLTANNDVKFNGSVATGGGALTVNAGKSVAINSDITTANGDVTINANTLAHPLSIATIDMLTGKTIDAGSGNVTIVLNSKPNDGDITLSSIKGKIITVLNQGLTAGSDLILNLGAKLTASGTNNPIVLCSDSGDFINGSGLGTGTLVTTGGSGARWLVYTGSPAGTTLGGLAPDSTFYSSFYTDPAPGTVPVSAGNSVLYRTPNPGGGGGGGGGGAAGGIVGGAVGGAAAAGVAAGTVSGLGLLPGLLLGLASPIQFDETMLDIICASTNDYPLLTRNMQYVYQIDDICRLDPNKIGSTKFIPDSSINNGSYELVKVKIPAKFANAPKGLTVRITQKSQPFGISKNIPDMNFNVFNRLSDKGIGKIYETRRFLKPNYLSQRVATIANRQVYANNGIVQKTILIKPNETQADLSIAVNYLRNGQFPKKNSPARLEKQAYSFVIQFFENQ